MDNEVKIENIQSAIDTFTEEVDNIDFVIESYEQLLNSDNSIQDDKLIVARQMSEKYNMDLDEVMTLDDETFTKIYGDMDKNIVIPTSSDKANIVNKIALLKHKRTQYQELIDSYTLLLTNLKGSKTK